MSDASDQVRATDTTSHAPQVVSSRTVYEGSVVTLRVDEISVPQGGRAIREVVEHRGAVVMIALDHEDYVYLVRQYRHAIGQELLEFPAGTLEAGEEPLAAAKRELREEVGLVAAEWRLLGSFFSSPGFANEHIHVFLARNLSEQECEPDYDEDLTVVRMPLSELGNRLGDIPDAKSLAALHLLQGGVDHGDRR
jgi:8-oxo-dGTP pyrophosphatase MutT (NUDIX family)